MHQGQATDWNTCVIAFDVDTFAEQAYEAGAGYVMFLLGQCSGYFCSPNSAYDAYTGYQAGERCSERDLIMELSDALGAKGIKLMLYPISHSPYNDVQATNRLGSPELAANGYHYQPTPLFRDRWSEVIQEWSNRYGTRVSSWWFDGYYSDHLNYDDSFCEAYSKAVKSGNPDSIATYNPGLFIKKETVCDEYAAGEMENIFNLPTGRWVEGIQWHCLTFLGGFWGYTNSKYAAGEIIQYVKTCTDLEGVVTLDVGVSRDGHISPVQLEIMRQMNQVVWGVERI